MDQNKRNMTAAAWNVEEVFSDEDLRTEILARLPVKSVVRCRCVCKAWRALISHPLFVKKYTSRRTKSKSTLRLLLASFPLRSVDYEAQGEGVEVAFREHYYPASLPKPKQTVELYGSCHGLVCLAIDYHNIILWNPSTGESNLLPQPAPRSSGHNNLDFYGFGYDSTTQDYKVVRGYDYEVFPEFNFEVFSLKTGSWRLHPFVGPTFDVDSFEDYFSGLGHGFLANEALHWIDLSRGDVIAILVFSLADEKLQTMLPNIPYSVYKFEVGTVGDCLSVYAEVDRTSSLWVMKEYGVPESWTEVLNFDPLGCLGTNNFQPMSSYNLRPLCFLENGELLLADTEGDYDYFLLYDPKGNTFRNLIESDAGPPSLTIDAESLARPVLGPITYEETIVSPVIGSM